MRQVVTILEVINNSFNNIFEEIPCYNTIENWVKKCGLDIYNTSCNELNQTKYAQIVDESMMIGSEKLLLAVATPAEHLNRPLYFNDVSFLNIAVAESWNGEGVANQIETSAAKVGHAPEYVITDNAAVMNKGVRLTGFKHHHDISHSLGMFLERTYKNEVKFINYCKLMTAPKFKLNMKPIAYLLPPKQRTVTRFMNMTDWIVWSRKMLEVFDNLSSEEKDVFSFIPENATFIEELYEVQKCINSIEKICKNNGLSKKNVKKCKQIVSKYLLKGNERMIRLGNEINIFLTKEIEIVKKNAIHNNSSDIIESIFGKYKYRKSPNKLNGVTSFILILPLYTKLLDNTGKNKYNFKHALENVKIKDIEVWKNENLTPNLVQLRINKLKKTA